MHITDKNIRTKVRVFFYTLEPFKGEQLYNNLR